MSDPNSLKYNSDTNLEELLSIHKRNFEINSKKKEAFGLHVPEYVENSITDTLKKIHDIERELHRRNPTKYPLPKESVDDENLVTRTPSTPSDHNSSATFINPPSIPTDRKNQLRYLLLDTDETSSARKLRTLFNTPELASFRDKIPVADDAGEMADLLIDRFYNRRDTQSRNVLILLIDAFANQYKNEDIGKQFVAIRNDLALFLEPRPFDTQATFDKQEANPNKLPMQYFGEIEKIYKAGQAIARADVPRYLKGESRPGTNGTAWLIAPHLAITCRHVAIAFDTMINIIQPSDVEQQIAEMILRFDYSQVANGVEYRIESMLYPTIDTYFQHKLDYAVLRVQDRSDFPLQQRGFLKLELEPALTPQTLLPIIQHPLGQIKQIGSDVYVDRSPNEGRILYRTPTEPGTSGSPVFNQANWQVVALHNGENGVRILNEGTLLSVILEDLKQNLPELHAEIMQAQATLK